MSKNKNIDVNLIDFESSQNNFLYQNCDKNSTHEEKNTSIKSSFIKKKNKINKLYIYLLTINVSLAYLFLGINIGVTDTLHENFIFIFNWNENEAKIYLSNLTSFLSLGAMLGSLIIAPMLLKRGRRFCIIYTDFIGVFGLLLMNVVNIYIMTLGRFICGISLGIYTTCIGIYIKEFVPYEMIGICGSIYELNYSIGISFSYLLGINIPAIENMKGNNWWRFMLSIPSLFLIINLFFLFAVFKHETPFYLYIVKGDIKRSREVLETIYCEEEDINKILDDLYQVSLNQASDISMKDLFTKKYRFRFFIVLFLLITQQACGIDAFLMYSDTIFMQGGKDKKTATNLTNLCGLFLILSGVTTILIIEKFGRRLLLILGQTICFVFLVLLAYFYFINSFGPVIYLVIGFLFVNGVTLSPLSFIYAADVLPVNGVGVGLFFNNVFSYLTTQFFLFFISSSLKTQGTMLIFSSFIFVNLIITILFLKETRGLSSDEIDQMYSPQKINEKRYDI